MHAEHKQSAKRRRENLVLNTPLKLIFLIVNSTFMEMKCKIYKRIMLIFIT